jgi:hypothetical protein
MTTESKSWPGRRESLLHYRMTGQLPDIPQRVAITEPRKRATLDPVTSTWMFVANKH